MPPAFFQGRLCQALALVSVCLLVLTALQRLTDYGPLNSQRVDYGSAPHSSKGFSPREQAANRTLGFQSILAVSKQPGWRTKGMQAAAKLTGIDITIPTQAHNPIEFVHAFEGIPADIRPKHGSALAWLAHLDMVKFVVMSGFTTALIMEDDVDWDVDLLNQMRLVSDNVRNYSNTPIEDTSPFGSEWDLLWIGHCGDRIDDNANHVVYQDPTRISTADFYGWSKPTWMRKIPEGHRRVQKPVSPVCTFGIAMTQVGAQKILDTLGRGGGEAYDVSMQHQCVSGQLKCISVLPQLFSHYEPPPNTGYVSFVHTGDGQGDSADDSNFEHVKGTTANIVNSARCRSIFNEPCIAPPTIVENPDK